MNPCPFDLSGNTQSDGANAYTYDAESQIKTAAGVIYLYDGSGRRVSKSSGKLYWYGSGGEILAETNAAGATLNEYIFFAGKRVAMLPAGGNPEYYAEDLLGKLDWHKGDPNGKGYWEQNDHWHWIPGGKKEKWHYEPGDTIKSATVKAVIVTAVIVYWIVSEGSRVVFPPRKAIPLP
jgi:hypothetical protein